MQDVREFLFPKEDYAPTHPASPRQLSIIDTQPLPVLDEKVREVWARNNLATEIYNATGKKDWLDCSDVAKRSMLTLSVEQRAHFIQYLRDATGRGSTLSLEACRQISNFIAQGGRISMKAVFMTTELSTSISFATGCSREVADQKAEEIFKRVNGDEDLIKEITEMLVASLSDEEPISLDEIDLLGVQSPNPTVVNLSIQLPPKAEEANVPAQNSGEAL